MNGKLLIDIDKTSEIPVYKQIIEQIASRLKEGALVPGDRLPPERELALELEVSRGTVKKAYEELKSSKVIEVIRGSGSFISGTQNVLPKDRKQKAIAIIDTMLRELGELGFSWKEFRTLTDIRITEMQKNASGIRIAGVDCNPEALASFKNQLSYISNIEFKSFLLDQLEHKRDATKLLQEFDLILTTSTHYVQLQALLPSLHSKIIRTALSPSQQTVIDLATIPARAKIGVFCISEPFLNIIKVRLKSFDINLRNLTHLVLTEESVDHDALEHDRFEEFFSKQDILILPPELDSEGKASYYGSLEKYRAAGGKIIRFDYQIERGSLIYLEEQIAKLINK